MCVGEKQKVIPAQAGVLGTEVSPAPLAEMPGHSETEESNCRVGLTGNPLPLFPPPQAPSGCEKEIFPMTFDGRCLGWFTHETDSETKIHIQEVFQGGSQEQNTKGGSEAGSGRGMS